MKRTLSFILAYFLIISQVFAVTGVPSSTNWVKAGLGGGGTFPMVVPDNHVSGKFYLVSDVGYPYVTTDSGDNWDWLIDSSTSGFSTSVMACITQSRNDANLMFAMSGGQSWERGILRSIDGGKNWTKTTGSYGGSRPSAGKVIAIDPSNDNNVYVASNTGVVARSTDKGLTWATIFNPFEHDITSESAELNGSGNTRTGKLNNVIYIKNDSITFTSSGETFTDNASGVLTGSAGGSGTVNYSTGDYSLTFASTPTTTTVAYTIRYSANWIYVNHDGTKVFVGNKITSGGGKGLKVWDVAGQTLTPITLSPTTVSSYAVYRNNVSTYDTYINGSGVEVLCVPVGIQIACSDDDGANWTYTSDATSPATYSGNARYINRFAVSRQADGQLRFVSHLIFDSNNGTSGAFVRYSSNSGSTWATSTLTRNYTVNPTFTSSNDPVPESIVDDPNDDEVFFLNNNHTVFRSDNGGATFNEKSAGAQIIVATDIKIAPDGTMVKCGMDMGCQKSNDFGATWNNLIPKYPFSESGVSYPGGHYWALILRGTYSEWKAGLGKIIVTSNYWYDMKPRIHYSLNSGATFTTTQSGLPTAALYGDVIWDKGYIRALDANASGTVIYVATDGSNCQANPSLPYDCTTNFTSGGLFKSTDYGATWTTVWTQPNKIYNALSLDPTDTTGNTLLFGTFGYNLYRMAPSSENAELNGSGQTRTGTLNKKPYVVSKTATFTSSSEVFTDSSGNGTLTSNLGGNGTINYTTGDYSLTFISTPSTTTATYNWRGYVGDSNGPGGYIFDVAYNSEGKPYAVGQSVTGSDAAIWESVYTEYGNSDGSWGTWKLMKQFPSNDNTIGDAILIDPKNNNRIFMTAVNGKGGTSDGNRVYVTVDAENGANATWYDITGDLPSMGGCNKLVINYFESAKGFLYCASPSADILKLDLNDLTTGLTKGMRIAK